MKKIFTQLLILILFISSNNQLYSQQTIVYEADEMTKAAKQILTRTVGISAGNFDFEMISKMDNKDVYRVSAVNGKVIVRGSSVVAMARGAYDYLINACNFQISRYGNKITLPKPLPEYRTELIVLKTEIFSYLDFNTFGNEVAYWDWADWEKELDIMALNGINTSLAMVGQEAVWQNVYKKLGIKGSELDDFFASPALSPLQQRGNFAGSEEPMPQSYINKTKDLQIKILSRMKQFGIKPILPVFNGVVPYSYIKKNPGIVYHTVKNWNSISDKYQAYLLTPGTTNFLNIGLSFNEEYNKLYKNYLPDEVFYSCKFPDLTERQLTNSGISQKLTLLGRNILDIIRASEKKGAWLVNLSPNNNLNSFEENYNVKKLIEGSSKDDVIIVFNTNWENKVNTPNSDFNSWSWIVNLKMPYNKTILSSDFTSNNIISNYFLAKNNIGFSYAPENIYSNDFNLFYLTYVLAENKQIDIKNISEKYSNTRYGEGNTELFTSLYNYLNQINSNNFYNKFLFLQNSPELSNYDQKISDLNSSLNAVLNKKPVTKNNTLLNNDLTELTSYYISEVADLYLVNAFKKLNNKQTSLANSYFSTATELLKNLDALSTHSKSTNFENVVKKAMNLGYNKVDSLYYYKDSKKMLFSFGPESKIVSNDVKTKLWSGMIRNFTIPNLQKVFKAKDDFKNINKISDKNNWINSEKAIGYPITTGNIADFLPELIKQASNYEEALIPAVNITYFSKDNSIFAVLASTYSQGTIHYTTNKLNPTASSDKYSEPINVSGIETIKAIIINDEKSSKTAEFNIIPSLYKNYTITPVNQNTYKSINSNLLNDGLFAKNDKNDPAWTKFDPMQSTIVFDLGKFTNVNELNISFYYSKNENITLTNTFIIEASKDGKKYENITNKSINIKEFSDKAKNNIFIELPPTVARFIKISPISFGANNNEKNIMLIDEITIK